MTPITDVYNRFLSKVTEYKFIEIQADSEEELNEILRDYLDGAIVRFFSSTKELGITGDTFNETLNKIDIEILSVLMIAEYLDTKLYHSKHLEQKLTTRDYKAYSEANLIKEIKDLRKYVKKEANYLINRYSFVGGLDDLDE